MAKENHRPGSLARRVTLRAEFDEVLALIDSARTRALTAVNSALIDLYWQIGRHISGRIAANGWGKGTVKTLAAYIQRRHPGLAGFSPQNLWRMRQFYDMYGGQSKLSPLVRELSWTHNLIIMNRSKRAEEREFYLRTCVRERTIGGEVGGATHLHRRRYSADHLSSGTLPRIQRESTH